ncbi:MAG: hypothetical protein ABSG73_03135 [Candidatus Aminicenantales bacterium]|jgi:hypothetical protein
MKDAVMARVTHPPSLNLIPIVTVRIDRHRRRPRRLTANFLRRCSAGVFSQWRHMPS